MDLAFSPEEEAFRAEVRAWLESHRPGIRERLMLRMQAKRRADPDALRLVLEQELSRASGSVPGGAG